VLNGTKCWITNGGEADVYTVSPRSTGSTRHKGICALVISRGTPGLSAGKKEDKMGQRASDTRVIHFDNVRVPVADRLGEEGEGFKIAMQTLEPDAAADRRARHRHCSPRARRVGRVCQGAQGVRVFRSAAFRPCSSCWPTWRRTSRPVAC
jgi:hypothetical protein